MNLSTAIGQRGTLHGCVRAAGTLRGEEPKGELAVLEEVRRRGICPAELSTASVQCCAQRMLCPGDIVLKCCAHGDAVLKCCAKECCAHGVLCPWDAKPKGCCAHGVLCPNAVLMGMLCSWGAVLMGCCAQMLCPGDAGIRVEGSRLALLPSPLTHHSPTQDSSFLPSPSRILSPWLPKEAS